MGTEQGKLDLSVLITGAGAPLAVSIFKAFRHSVLNPRIVATDAEPLSVGLFRADAAYLLPAVTRDETLYLQRLEDICLRENVSLVCFGSEIEMRRVAPHTDDVERRTRAKLILNQPYFLRTFMDKWRMICFLRDKDLPVPDTVLATDEESVRAFLTRHAFPMILKPRRGSGSKNVFVVRSPDELDALSRYVSEPVLQEYLLPDDEEYTVGVYKSPRTGYIGQIALRRRLAAGVTYKSEVVCDDDIQSVCRRLVESCDIWGPVNVQLRKTAAGVRIFEINLRFSSSAVMRAYFGFNEAELCLRDVILGETIASPEIGLGCSLRYWDELYLAPEESRLQVEGQLVKPRGRKLDSF
jgi:carbamoyl-phosphate synthase large subunit